MNMHQKTLLYLLLSLLVCGKSGAADYPVSSIPETLRKGAHVIKRFEDIRLEVVSPGESILRKKYVLTVLDAEGASFADLQEHYDELRSVRSLEGQLFDASGKELRTLKPKEIKDYSAISEISMYEDGRVKQHSFGHTVYPYTVAYEVVIRNNHCFYFDAWRPQETEGVAVEQSRFTLVTPAGYQVRIKAFNYSGAPVTKAEGNRQVQEWMVQNLPAAGKLYAAPPYQERFPVVYLAPTEFAVAGYKGSMNSWKELGQFQLGLNSGRDQLPDAIKQQVKQLVQGAATTREQAERLYHFLQQNTRYISVQLGIGGWQPFNAAYVVKNRYGDCKALSNYMYSLLKEAGIPSHYALIKAGPGPNNRKMLEDFPMNQFNHAIICVPLEKDTLWLECTSQTNPAGYMGSFTGNRKALLVTPEGGVLAATPRYGLSENLLVRNMAGKLDLQGNLMLEVHTRYTGLQQEDREELTRYSSREKVQEALNETLRLPSFEVLQFKYHRTKSSIPEISETLSLQLPRYASVSGKRLFLQPNLLAKSSRKIEVDSSRKVDYVFDSEYRDVDSFSIELPEGYVAEVLPREVNLNTRFGKYHYSLKLQQNKVVGLRRMEQYAVRVSPSEAPQMIDFWHAIYKADRSQVVLVREKEQKETVMGF